MFWLSREMGWEVYTRKETLVKGRKVTILYPLTYCVSNCTYTSTLVDQEELGVMIYIPYFVFLSSRLDGVKAAISFLLVWLLTPGI